MKRPLYLDYNATTPMDPRVLDEMTPYFLEEVGNAGSRTHSFGQCAKEAVESARKQVAELIGRKAEEIVFTSGATESNNIALLGLMRYASDASRKHVLASAIEHKAVLEPLERLRELGFEVELLPVTSGGYVETETVCKRLRPDTLVVSVMHANNETGVLQPVLELGEILAETKTLFHVDAAQTFGKEVEALRLVKCDLISISGHKVYGPKGIGALYARRRGGQKRPLTPLVVGGGQEMGLRAGTLPVPLVVGLGKASELAEREFCVRREAAKQVKDRLLQALGEVDHRVNGDPTRTQSHVVNVSFPGVDSEALMLALRSDIAISNGSACTSASYSPSHVLKAMGLSDDVVSSSVRISWGPGVTDIPTAPLINAVRGFLS